MDSLEFRKEIPGYMLRHKVKSGVTGWAQINGLRGDTSIKKRIDCDLYYIKLMSRRNQMIKAFDLHSEYELTSVVDLSSYLKGMEILKKYKIDFSMTD